MLTQTLSVNMIPSGVKPMIYVSQYDSGLSAFEFYLKSQNADYTIPTGALIWFTGRAPIKPKSGQEKRVIFSNACNWTNNPAKVTVNVTQQMTSTPGLVECEILVLKKGATGTGTDYNLNDKVGSVNLLMRVERSAILNEYCDCCSPIYDGDGRLESINDILGNLQAANNTVKQTINLANQLQTRLDTMQQQLTDAETSFNTQLTQFQNLINQSFTTYQTTINSRLTTYENTINSRINSFQTQIDNAISSLNTSLGDAIAAIEAAKNAAINSMQNEVGASIDSMQDALLEAIYNVEGVNSILNTNLGVYYRSSDLTLAFEDAATTILSAGGVFSSVMYNGAYYEIQFRPAS